MIPFFRKIRKKLAGENQFPTYSNYVIRERVLPVAGILKTQSVLWLLAILIGCTSSDKQPLIQDLDTMHPPDSNQIWLSHEHILVDFIGADSIQPDTWNHDSIIKEVLPSLDDLKEFGVDYFVDATPNYLGRDVVLLEKISHKTGLRILTNTGLYGARNNKFIPSFAHQMTAEDLAQIWIDEFENGIDHTAIKPGFIKIGIDTNDPLHPMHQKLVKAAALTHMKTGLTIASHTGEAAGLWPQLAILKEMGVSPQAFIWVHAQTEEDNERYLEAAEMGCWISLDGLGWDIEKHLAKILFAKRNGILDRILISHDSGWFDPQKEKQTIKPYTAIFKTLYEELKMQGFTDEEFNLLVSVNPVKAYSIKIKNHSE
ncbi:phosphotriesterase [Lutimonas sp.]|uniref:phosphotriesterase family protein n=1 Tax=Lutimonas sp. TaxID=1872403 RepID=UPI003D9BE45B